MIVIRDARPADMDSLVALAFAMHPEEGTPFGEPDEPGFRDFVTELSESDGGVVRVAEIDGKLAGAFCALITSTFFSRSTPIFAMNFWWVDPGHTGEGIGKAMLEDAEDLAKGLDAAAISMGVMWELPAAKGILETRGYTPIETVYVKEVEAWQPDLQ